MGDQHRPLRLRVCLDWEEGWTDGWWPEMERWMVGESRAMHGGQGVDRGQKVWRLICSLGSPAVGASRPGGVWGWASGCRGECEDSAWGCGYQTVLYSPLPYWMPRIPAQMAMCRGCSRREVGTEARDGSDVLKQHRHQRISESAQLSRHYCLDEWKRDKILISHEWARPQNWWDNHSCSSGVLTRRKAMHFAAWQWVFCQMAASQGGCSLERTSTVTPDWLRGHSCRLAGPGHHLSPDCAVLLRGLPSPTLRLHSDLFSRSPTQPSLFRPPMSKNSSPSSGHSLL